MIDSISKLNPDEKKKVLAKLHKLGEKNGHYVRYSYKEFLEVVKYLVNYAYEVDTLQTSNFLDANFNLPETNILRDIMNLSEKRLEAKYPDGIQNEIKKMNTRTRLAVNRIQKGIQEEQQKQESEKSAFQKLKAKIFS